jgi:hypothetical protein
MQTDLSEEHWENASFGIRDSFDPGSNSREERVLHWENASSPRNSTDAGIESDSNCEQHKSASSSIRFNCVPNSNVSSEIEPHP